MRIAIGGLSHETNQYVGAPTVLADFNVTRGSETFRRHAGRTYIGGMLDAAAELGIDVVGTQHAVAQPSGSISADTYAALKEGLLESISLVMPCDAVVLELHGAAAAVGIDDVEADVCVAVRELVGPALTFVVTHDLHGNVSQLEADAVSAMFACRHYPHDDMYETGRRAVESVPRIMSREWKPRTSVEA
ncbi:MAG: M81 family metallopeptidase, partial [bacterium]|nr:M81 family metallopeptidase [bacterium]